MRSTIKYILNIKIPCSYLLSLSNDHATIFIQINPMNKLEPWIKYFFHNKSECQSDGWAMMGLKELTDRVKRVSTRLTPHPINNPEAEDREVYFTLEVTHAVRCNQIFNLEKFYRSMYSSCLGWPNPRYCLTGYPIADSCVGYYTEPRVFPCHYSKMVLESGAGGLISAHETLMGF